MAMHPSTFQYLKPTDAQLATMEKLRDAGAEYCAAIEALMPDGPDKTYVIRKLREVAMWVNVSVTRQADGSPRGDG